MRTLSNPRAERRAELILARLATSELVRVSELADELNVSEMTVRRDLLELEANGAVRRVRGGAIPVGPVPRPFDERVRRQARAKARIAQKLLPLVGETGAVGIDASSTLMKLAALLPGGRDLMIITNSLETFRVLQGKPGITAVITGGQLDPRTDSLTGPLASRASQDLFLRRLFVSAAGVDPALGSTESCLEEADVKRSFGEVASEVILSVDSTKLGKRAVAQAFRWNEIALLVTDLDPSDHRLDPYRHVEIL